MAATHGRAWSCRIHVVLLESLKGFIGFWKGTREEHLPWQPAWIWFTLALFGEDLWELMDMFPIQAFYRYCTIWLLFVYYMQGQTIDYKLHVYTLHAVLRSMYHQIPVKICIKSDALCHSLVKERNHWIPNDAAVRNGSKTLPYFVWDIYHVEVVSN